ncbi:MAG: ATP-binding cassette domain-containing protein [Nannocystales bacterium]
MTAWTAAINARVGGFELDVELDGDEGVLALVGPNGSGKTSFLRLLAGVLRPSVVELSVSGTTLASSTQGIDIPAEERRIGYLPQGYGLFPHLGVLDNVGFGLASGPVRMPRAQRHEKARALLGQLGCASLAERRVQGLSGGEQQRVALARALVLEPNLLLLDEPLAALDATSRRAVRRFLTERLQAFGRPAIVVTHDVRDVEALAARVAVVERGKVVQVGDLDALRARPASEFVSEFLGL